MATTPVKVRPAAKPSKPSATARKPATAAKRAPAKKAPAKKTPVAAKPLAAPVPVPAAPATKPASADKPKVEKQKKPKLVRDSFTIPKAEYAAIDTLKQRATQLGQSPKKSEVLRAGIMLLAGLNDAALLAALAQVPAIKTGRPKA